MRGVLFNWRPQDMTTCAMHMSSCPNVPLEKGVESIFSNLDGSLVGSSFIRFSFRRRRRGRYVAYVALRLAFSLRLCCVHVVGGFCTRMHVVGGGVVCLVPLRVVALALLAYSSLLLLSLPLFCLSQWKARQLASIDLGRTSSVN